jgi:subtilisin family serine protease
MSALELVQLSQLMKMSQGSSLVQIGLVDGPVALNHPDLASARLRVLPGTSEPSVSPSRALRHGTFIAGILAGRRGSLAPSIAPACPLVIRPVFKSTVNVASVPAATPEEVAEALVDCVDAGVRIVNLSAALIGVRSITGGLELGEALRYVASRGVLLVAAAGNDRVMASSAVTRHPWVIPVTACGRSGAPVIQSNLGRSIGTRGLGGPGEAVRSLAPGGGTTLLSGTSVAAPFVSAAAALLWSHFPSVAASDVRRALLLSGLMRRRSVSPPLLNAWRSFQSMSVKHAVKVAS